MTKTIKFLGAKAGLVKSGGKHEHSSIWSSRSFPEDRKKVAPAAPVRPDACGCASRGRAARTGGLCETSRACRPLLVLLGLERSAILSTYIGKVVLARSFHTSSLPVTVQTL
eukprot:4516546-Amphidinium_carterae.1